MKPKLHSHIQTRSSPNTGETLYRSFEFDRASVDEAARTVALSFSSEMPVERYFGSEVLDHSAGAVRLGRLNNGAPLLLNHDRDEQIGVVESATIDAKTKRGRAVVRFSKSAEAEEIFQDVMDGIRRLVSVGYRIHKTVTENKSGGVEIVRVTDWEPYEISLVSIPADDSVGVGRGEASADNPHSNNHSPSHTMNTESTPAPAAAENAAATRTAEAAPAAPVATIVRESAPSTEDAVTRAMTAERTRVGAIQALAEQARSQNVTIDERAAITNGLTVDAFREQVLAAVIARTTDYQPANLSRSERRDIGRFDLGNAVRSMINDSPLTGIEREMLLEGQREAQAAGIGYGRGITLPSFLVRTQRDLTATGGTGGDQGGNTVATVPTGLLDDFFNASIMRALGATVLTGLTQNLDFPRLVAGTAAAKKGENGAADEVSPTTAKLSLTPKRLPAFIDLSQQLLMQSNAAIESVIRMHLTNQMLATQEAAFFHGSGTEEAAGIAGTSGIGSVAGGTNGAAPTFAHMVSLEGAVDTVNALGGNLRYATNGQIRAKLKVTPKQSSGVEGNFILTDLAPNIINGHRTEFSNAISRTLTKGSASSVCSAIFFGNFADYIIGYWGGLQLELLRDSTNAKSGLYTLVANTYYDGGVVRPKSFAAMLDALGA